MPQILVFTNRIELKTLIEIECNTLQILSTTVREDPTDFIGLLEMFEEIQIVVVDEPTADLVEAIKKKEDKIEKIIVLSSEPVFIASARLFSFEAIEDFLKYLRLITEENEKKNDEYISIPIASLVHFSSLPIDIFIRLSAGRYVKAIHANDDIDINTIMGLEERGVKDIHFEKKYNRELTTMLLDNMIKKITRDYVTIGDKLKANSEVFDTTREIVSKMGLPPKIINVAESVVKRISEEVKNEPSAINSYLNQLRTDKSLEFTYRFAEISSFLATKIVLEMPEANQDRVKKVIFACLFSDISLVDRSHIHMRSSENLSNLSLAHQKEINEHAFKASEIISRSRHAPLEVEKLIKQHHGSLTGFGFKKEISTKLSPFSLCIIAAQEVAYGTLIDPKMHIMDVILLSKKIHNSDLLDMYFAYIEKDLLL